MVAVSDAGIALPVVPLPVDAAQPVAAGRRVVAIAVSATELLRPGSDLVRLMAGAHHVDLLLACEDEPVAALSPVGVLGGALVDGTLDDGDDDGDNDVAAAVALLGLDELEVHRLALRPPLDATAEADLVAALSELVGFDPEPGVQCLAPVPGTGGAEQSAVDRAVQQIVQVYGLSLQRYRCLELSVVDGNGH